MTEQEFQTLLQEKEVILLDGAMGSNMMKAGMPKGVCTEFWIYEHPELQEQLQRAYVEAGSHIIYAPTFMANRAGLEGFGLEDQLEELNRTLVQRTKAVAEGKCLVAGDLSGLTGKDLDYDQLLQIYQEQIQVLADAGVDLLVAETMIGMEETMAVIDAARNTCQLPIMCTMTVEADGSLLMGGNVYESVVAFEAMGASAVGINCSLGPDQLEAIVRQIKELVSIPVIAKPNAGVPTITDTGEALYSMEADTFAQHMVKLKEAGATILGGCCGTDPAYIRAMKERL